jgi:hypothetical protein
VKVILYTDKKDLIKASGDFLSLFPDRPAPGAGAAGRNNPRCGIDDRYIDMARIWFIISLLNQVGKLQHCKFFRTISLDFF